MRLTRLQHASGSKTSRGFALLANTFQGTGRPTWLTRRRLLLNVGLPAAGVALVGRQQAGAQAAVENVRKGYELKPEAGDTVKVAASQREEENRQ